VAVRLSVRMCSANRAKCRKTAITVSCWQRRNCGGKYCHGGKSLTVMLVMVQSFRDEEWDGGMVLLLNGGRKHPDKSLVSCLKGAMLGQACNAESLRFPLHKSEVSWAHGFREVGLEFLKWARSRRQGGRETSQSNAIAGRLMPNTASIIRLRQ